LITGAGMVLVSGSNTSPALTSDLAGTAGDNYSTGYYRTAHNDLYQGAAAAKFAVEVLGISSAAAIHDGDPYTEGLATAFADAFAALGGDVTAVTAVNKGDTDMVPVLTEVAAGSPEMLFFPIFMPEGGFIVQQVGEVSGMGDVVLMGADGLISENFMALPESEGVFMSGPDLDFAGNSNQATGQTGDGFLAAYEAEHGETPAAPFWGHAYDATTMLLDAISAASSDDGGTLVIDRAGVRQYLNSISGYSGIIGVLTCDDFGDCGSQRISVIQHNDSSDWQAGTANVVFTYNPTSSALVGDIAAAAADSADPIKLPIHNWSSQIAGVYAVGAILESNGNSVEYISADSTLVYTAMCEGDMDLVHEVWQGAFGVAFEEQVDAGCVIDAATHDAKTREEWWYPSYVEDVCPGLPDWEALNDCADLFATPDSGGKGRFLGGPVDWLKGDQERVEGLEMDFIVENAGTAGALWSALEAASANNEPIVLFNWTPNFIEAMYDGKFIEFPTFADECRTDASWGINPETTHDCGNPKDGYLKLGVWEGFPAKWPTAYAAVQKMNLPNLDVAQLAMYVDIDGMEPEDAAALWLAENCARWTGWSGADQSACPAAPEAPAGLANDAVHGVGASAWEAMINNPVGPADDSLDPILVTMANLEGDAIGSFPEIREGLEIAVAQINNDFGGIGGRPISLDVCVHGFDPNAAINCSNEIAATNPHVNINGIEFFTPALWPTFVGAGIPTLQTVPIFVSDFTVDNNGTSVWGGCPVAFPGAASFTVEHQGYEKIAVLYSTTPPGMQCFADTEERFWDYLTTEYDFEWQGFGDNSGDPTDDDAVVQAIADFFGDSTSTVVFFGIQSADCNVVMNAIRAAGVETDVVASGSCIDDSVLANPSAVGAFFGQQGYISERPDLYDPFIGFQLGVREALLDDSPLRTAPVSAFLRVGHATGIMVWQVLERMLADGQDIDDRAAINSAFVSMENQHVVGTPPVNCTDNTPEFPAVCKKDLTFTVWNGSEWELGPLNGELINVGDIQARVAVGNPRG